ncbi:MAG TPA: hypothetical protein VLA66_13475 [Thermoanaerobaculia bacterium]|nr:hypothetical protein [Thermoanaerobaculia bacterium]
MSGKTRYLGVAAAALALYAATTHPRVFAAGNDASRWAQVESLVDHGTASIEHSRFRQTVDRVEIGGRVYSNKPPALAFLGAALSWPLEATTGWRLGDPETAGRAIWVLTLLLVGVPGALTVATFDCALRRFHGVGRPLRAGLTVALGAGTLLLSFAGTFQSHVPAAFLLLLALLAALDGRAGASGLWAGLAGALDLLPGFGLAPFLAAIAVGGEARRRRRALPRFAAGLGVGLVVAVAANLATTGSPLPPKMVPGAIDAAAAAGPSVAGVVLPQSAGYPLEILFGPHGLFTVSPVLVFGLLGLLVCCWRPHFARPAAWRWLALGILVQVAGHALLAGSYGGWSYGYRYLLPIQPLLLFAAPAVLVARPLKVAFAALLPVSVLFAALGAFHPWPPAFEQATQVDPVAATVRNPIGGNAAALAEQKLPGGRLASGLGARWVDPDPEVRRRYYRLFFASKGDLETMRRFER